MLNILSEKVLNQSQSRIQRYDSEFQRLQDENRELMDRLIKVEE